MVKIILSAFSDEYSADFDDQIAGLRRLGIPLMEIRGVSGTNVGDITKEQAREVHEKLEDGGIGISAIGSPLGKISITDPVAPHIEKLKRVIETAHTIAAERIRMFSFYMPKGAEDYSPYREEVIERLGMMLDVAESENMILCHENEKGIYGDSPERCLELIDAFGGRLKCVFDPANFAQCGYEVYPAAYRMLEDRIYYFHVKDTDASGKICIPGTGTTHIGEFLHDALAKADNDVIVTLEPHLFEFVGLADLENGEKSKMTVVFENSHESFEAGLAGLKSCISDLL